MAKVRIEQRFIDRHTGKMRNVGEVVELTDDRIDEIMFVNPMLISVLDEEKPKKASGKDKQ